MGDVVLVMAVSGSAETESKAYGYLADLNRITGLAISVSQADAWISLPFVAGSLPDEITAVVWVSNYISAGVSVSGNEIVATMSVDELTAVVVADSVEAAIEVDSTVATIETNEISAEVT